MHSSYPASPFHHAINQIINLALTRFSNRFSMSRHQARAEPEHIKPGAEASRGIAIEDWDVLFTAVKTRLALAAQPQANPATQSTAADAAQVERICATVLDCVAALEQLHMTVRDELAMRDTRGG